MALVDSRLKVHLVPLYPAWSRKHHFSCLAQAGLIPWHRVHNSLSPWWREVPRSCPIRIRSVAILVTARPVGGRGTICAKQCARWDTSAAPLCRWEMAVGGNFTVVANPNGGGAGVPLHLDQ